MAEKDRVFVTGEVVEGGKPVIPNDRTTEQDQSTPIPTGNSQSPGVRTDEKEE